MKFERRDTNYDDARGFCISQRIPDSEYTYAIYFSVLDADIENGFLGRTVWLKRRALRAEIAALKTGGGTFSMG